MTTPDIAGLCERLKTLWLELNDAHAEPPATARIMNALHQSGDTLERQAAEIKRLRGALTMTKGPLGSTGPTPVYEAVLAALTGEDT